MDTLLENLGIEYAMPEKEFFTAKMPVTPYYSQPQGYVIGGMYMLLAESAAGYASNILGKGSYYAVGQNIHATHVAPNKSDSGFMVSKGQLIHKVKFSHLWEIKIFDEENKLLSIISVQNFIITHK